MNCSILLIFSTILCVSIKADVSSLTAINNNHFRAFNGYNYDPPLQQLPSPAPIPPTSTTFIPEIIVNKGINEIVFVNINQLSPLTHTKTDKIHKIVLSIEFSLESFSRQTQIDHCDGIICIVVCP